MQQCNSEEAEIILSLYETKLKKYHTPIGARITERISTELISSLPVTPNVVTPTSISTPNVARNNDKNLMKNEQDSEKAVLIKLKESLDMHVAEAERLYYNCDYKQCTELTEAILREDPYHSGCLPVHISCQVELKQSNSKYQVLSQKHFFNKFNNIVGAKKNKTLR